MEATASGDYLQIRQRICDLYGVAEDAFSRPDRIKPAPQARHLCCHLLVARGYDLSAIGRAMGMNHTTVMRAVRNPRPMLEKILLKHVGIARRAEVEKRSAALLLDLQASGAEPPSERELYDKARFMYAAAPEHEKPEVWESACRLLYPHSWQRQAAQPPRLA
jgi:hypothetical protein